MRSIKVVLAVAAMAVTVVGSALPGCSKSTSPTNPNGGGGAGNTSFDSGTLTPPDAFVHTFPDAGTVGYHCNFHPMTGTVTVADGAADSAVVAVNAMSFVPQAVTVRPGGRVRWNVIADTHTVTSN